MQSKTTLSAWKALCHEAQQIADVEPVLTHYLTAYVLDHTSLQGSLGAILAAKLATSGIDPRQLAEVFAQVFQESPDLIQDVVGDLTATVERDPSVQGIWDVYLNHKGFQALQAYRMSHWLWMQERRALSVFLQCRTSEVFAVDIHPAARIGRGVFIDHGTGVVVGETAVIEDNVSLLQEVTLGGTGKEKGDRHPKIGKGVLICAGAKVLGNIRVGEGSKVGAGSVVLKDVAPHTTVVGVPAKPVGRPGVDSPALVMNQQIETDATDTE